MRVTVITIVIGALGTVTKRLVQGTGGLGNKRTSRDHPNYSIIKIGQNTEKSRADLGRFAVSQTPVRNQSVTAGVKNSQKKTNNNYWCARYNHQRISTRTGGLRNNRTSREHQNYCINQNSEKGSGDWRRFAVSQTPVRNQSVTAGVKNSQKKTNNNYWCARYNHQRISTRTGGLRNNRTSREHQNYWISQNNEKSSGDLRRFAVTQTLVRNHLLTLVRKTLERVR